MCWLFLSKPLSELKVYGNLINYFRNSTITKRITTFLLQLKDDLYMQYITVISISE